MTVIRTAVIIVHGMGEQKPLDTLKEFVRTALKPKDPGAEPECRRAYYYSRPALVTDSYEARRYIARFLGAPAKPIQGQSEIFEYHWSYMMTGNRFSDVIPTTLRLLLRPVWKVPVGLRGLWLIVWLVALAAAAAVLAVTFCFPDLGAAAKAAINSSIVAALIAFAWRKARTGVAASFVDVVRYLDTSPRSYSARRAIRGGMVDLLRNIHDAGHYKRIVVVAHSLGAYIAYDAMHSLWFELHALHAGPPVPPRGGPVPLAGLAALQEAADGLFNKQGSADEYQKKQFELWKGLRAQGNPWLITDFVSVGTPMYFADLLLTRNREEFDNQVRNGQLITCPPRAGQQEVEEAQRPETVKYWWTDKGCQVLGSGTMFAVVRWTNFWFPAVWSFFGDWFGGRLAPLFGDGIRDVRIGGNTPGRWLPGFAHALYFKYPDDEAPSGIAANIRQALSLDIDPDLAAMTVLDPDKAMTAERLRPQIEWSSGELAD
jgi:hypothetical protein